jgi:hypothetical protein
MPKITGTGTPSISGVPVPPQTFDQGQFFNKGEKDPAPLIVDESREHASFEEVPTLAGNSSSPSDDSNEKMRDKPKSTGNTRKPARTTGNRFK